MRSLSSMIANVQEQTSEVLNFTDRLRTANRRLVGGTGQAPTKLADARGSGLNETTEAPPLLLQLNRALEMLNDATADLRNEVSFLESVSETGDPGLTAPGTAYAGLSDPQAQAKGYFAGTGDVGKFQRSLTDRA